MEVPLHFHNIDSTSETKFLSSRHAIDIPEVVPSSVDACEPAGGWVAAKKGGEEVVRMSHGTLGGREEPHPSAAAPAVAADGVAGMVPVAFQAESTLPL